LALVWKTLENVEDCRGTNVIGVIRSYGLSGLGAMQALQLASMKYCLFTNCLMSSWAYGYP
jgi:hypothetical protein